MSILDEIVRHKREEVDRKKAARPAFDLKELSPARDFESSLRGGPLSVIAEIKQRSPSRGIIRADAEPADIAGIYETHGAAAISVLTDETCFGGKDEYLSRVKEVTTIPILRKEFIIDPYQIYESKTLGADAILLIAAILDRVQIGDFLQLAEEAGLSCLVEVHTEDEMEMVLKIGARIIGINSRDLTTMTVDITTPLRLRRLLPGDVIVVGESGIQDREDMVRFEEAGFDAVLIGETLMRAPDIGVKLKELLGL